MSNADFFASGHAALKRLIAWSPTALGVRLALAAIVCLMLPARLIGVHSMPTPGDDRGFWFEANWSLMFPLVLPVLFAGFNYMIGLIRHALDVLTSEQLRVIIKRKEATHDFDRYISEHLAESATPLTLAASGLAIVLTLADVWHVLPSIVHRATRPTYVDWTTMFANGRVDYWSNVAFDVVAYTAEGLAIFLGFFFILKFWLFLKIFSDSLRDDAVGYEFNPLVHDPDRRLGLRPLGAFMNLYLLLVIVFETYVLGRRLQLVGKSGLFSVSAYLSALASGARGVKNLFDPRMYQWNTIDTGLWLLLIFMTLPLIVGAYFPLWTLRRYVRKRRDDLWAESARAHEEAMTQGDEVEAAKLAKQMQVLEDAQLWPNGDATGWRLLAVSLALGIAAWAPPLCAALVALAIALELGKWVIGLRQTFRAVK
jgi:uncharacterized membrane protein YhaH (DUF805 family)